MSDEKEDAFDMSLLAPEAEPEAQPEVEPEAEPEVAGDEVVDEVDDQPEELPADDEPQSDPEPSNDLMDKEVQKLQQLRATWEREVQRLSQMDSPTEKQVERAEKAKSKLDKYLNEKDVDPYEAVHDISEEVLADRGRAELALQEFEAFKRETEEREARRDAEMARLRFANDYPELKGQYESLAQKTQEAMQDQFGEDLRDMSPSVFVKIANREFKRLVKEASSKAEPEPESRKGPVKATKKPKAANIIKTKSGGTVKSPQDSEARGESLIAKLGQDYLGS